MLPFESITNLSYPPPKTAPVAILNLLLKNLD